MEDDPFLFCLLLSWIIRSKTINYLPKGCTMQEWIKKKCNNRIDTINVNLKIARNYLTNLLDLKKSFFKTKSTLVNGKSASDFN